MMLGYAGYVNFGNIVFFGLGGYICVYLVSDWHWPLAAAALAAGVAVSLLALIFGLGILRLRGAFFALATIGVNEAVRAFVSNFEPWGGATGIYLSLDAYEPLGGPAQALWTVYFLIVAVMAASLFLSYAIKSSKFGLGLLAIGENEDAAAVLGVHTPRYKALAYSVSAFLPAIAGGLYFFKSGIIEPAGAFDLTRSIEAIVMVMLGGLGTVTGPALGAFLYEELRGVLLTTEAFSHFQLVIAGVAATRHRAVRAGRAHGFHLPALAANAEAARMTALLEVTGVSKRFGGLQAVQDLNFTVRRRRDPRPHRPQRRRQVDRVQSHQRRVSARSRPRSCSRARTSPASRPTASRATVSPARTRSCSRSPGMTVLENCTVGACFGRENLPLARAREVVREVAEIVGLADRLDHLAGQLTTAGKKRLELARALSARPKLLLLDEVLAGLNPTEIEHMIAVIRAHPRARHRHPDDRARDARDHEPVRPHRGAQSRTASWRRECRSAVANNPEVIEAYLGDAQPGGQDAEAWMSEPLLRVEELEAGYDEVQVLWGISLGVARGGMTTLVGANGAGKTTSLRAITGSIQPFGGRVLFAGEDVTRLAAPRQGRARAGAGAGRAAVVQRHERRGEPGNGRLLQARAAPLRRAARSSLHAVSAPEGTPSTEGRHVLRRRAADAGDRDAGSCPIRKF